MDQVINFILSMAAVVIAFLAGWFAHKRRTLSDISETDGRRPDATVAVHLMSADEGFVRYKTFSSNLDGVCPHVPLQMAAELVVRAAEAEYEASHGKEPPEPEIGPYL